MDNEKSNQRITNTALVVLSALAYFVVSILFETLAETFGPVARLHSNELAKHAIPVIAGVITLSVLMFNKNVHVFADECVTELRKVVWPSRRDTFTMTAVCCAMVLFAGLGFGVFDFLSSQLIKIFVH